MFSVSLNVATVLGKHPSYTCTTMFPNKPFGLPKYRGEYHVTSLMTSQYQQTQAPGNMEDRCSNRLSAENLYVMQKLEEILHQKEMEIASFESEIYSSQMNHSVVKHMKSTASRSKYKDILANGISKGLTDTDIMKEEERKMLEVMNGKKPLTDLKVSSSIELMRTSVGNSSRGQVFSNSRKSKHLSQASAVEWLIKQLRVLEKETETMKQEFFECLEESKQLVNEIYQLFQTTHNFLQHESQVNGEKPHKGSLILNSYKDAKKLF